MSDNKELIHRFYEALSRGDQEGKAACVAPDLRWWIPDAGARRTGRNNPTVGRDAWLAVSGRTADRYEAWHWHIQMMVASDDGVAVLSELEATPHGRPTHRLRYGMFFRIEGGLIAEAWELADTAAIFEKLGL